MFTVTFVMASEFSMIDAIVWFECGEVDHALTITADQIFVDECAD